MLRGCSLVTLESSLSLSACDKAGEVAVEAWCIQAEIFLGHRHFDLNLNVYSNAGPLKMYHANNYITTQTPLPSPNFGFHLSSLDSSRR